MGIQNIQDGALIEAGHYPSGTYRGAKGDIWEGGHRVPFIVQWKGKVPQSATNNNLVSLTDILATVADLNGEELPANAGQDSWSFLYSMLIAKAPLIT